MTQEQPRASDAAVAAALASIGWRLPVSNLRILQTIQPVVVLNPVPIAPGPLNAPVPVNSQGGATLGVVSSIAVPVNPPGLQGISWTLSPVATGNADQSFHLDFGASLYLRDFAMYWTAGSGAGQTSGYPMVVLWLVKPSDFPANNYSGSGWAGKPGIAPAATSMVISRADAPTASGVYLIHLSDAPEEREDLTTGVPGANFDWAGIVFGKAGGTQGSSVPWLRRRIPHFPIQAISIRLIGGANNDMVVGFQGLFTASPL